VFARLLWVGSIVWLAAFTIACSESYPIETTPTAPPTLSVNLWMTFPTTKVAQRQMANVVVYDSQGRPVSGASSVLEVSAGAYKKAYHFPLTSLDGQAQVKVEVPAEIGQQTVLVKVVVIQSASSQWGQATAEFEVLP